MNNKPYKLASFAIVTFFFLALLPLPLVAQEQTSSPSAVDQDSVRDNIKQRIQQAVTQTSPTQYGWYGLVQSITQDSITLMMDSQPKLIGINSNTSITQDNDSISYDQIEINSPIAAIGSIAESDSLNAETIISLSQPVQASTKKTALVTLEDINTRTDSLTTASSSAFPDLELDLITTTQLIDAQQDINSSDQLDLSDLSPKDQALIIYQPNPKTPQSLQLLLLYRTYSSPPTSDESASE